MGNGRSAASAGYGHLGIIEFPVPILKGNVEVIKSIREKLYEPEFSDFRGNMLTRWFAFPKYRTNGEKLQG